jgi:glycosyltransferase involved in cell wall biosynthesis
MAAPIAPVLEIAPPGPTVSVVVPCFRTPPGLEGRLRAVAAALAGARIGWPDETTVEFVLIDDSPDDPATWAQLSALAASMPDVTAVRRRVNGGEHRAVLMGLGFVAAPVIVVMDDDGQNPAQAVPKLVHAVRATTGPCVAYGVTDKRFDPPWRVASAAVAHAVGLPPASFKAFSAGLVGPLLRAAIDRFEGPGPVHVDALLLAQSPTVRRVPVEHARRAGGQSGYTFATLADVAWAFEQERFRLSPRVLRAQSAKGPANTSVMAAITRSCSAIVRPGNIGSENTLRA